MLTKIQLLSQAEVDVEHKFWEPSPTRLAMEKAKAYLAQLVSDDGSQPQWFFLGERLDGLWVAFLDESHARQFNVLQGR